jgi:transglutaminase-like putative cysteine protease
VLPAVLVVAVLAAIVAVPAIKSKLTLPGIAAIEPTIGEPGGYIRISGRHFGAERGDGRVEFDGAPPTASSYISWSDGSIELRVPLYAESSLVRVVNGAGRSNALMFMSRDLLPAAPRGSGVQALGPGIETLSVDSGTIGSVLTIEGLNFGANRDGSAVLFTWMGESAVLARNDESSRGFVVPQESAGEYESWSDKKIVVRIPDGAVSGGIAIQTAKGTSQVRYFQIIDSPGAKSYLGRKTYALSTFVTVSRIKATGTNALYLWLPFPTESPSQRGVKALGRSTEPFIPDFRGLSAYRLSDLENDKIITVSQDHLVQVYGIETDIKADKIRNPPSPASQVYSSLAAPDPLVPSDHKDIASFAQRAVGKEKNHYKSARLILDSLLAKVAIDDSSIAATPLDALKSGKADAWDLAILYAAMLRAAGIPSLPVAGVVVDESRRAWRHAWVEFYLYGFGWVPVDPALVGGARIGSFEAPFEDPARYFGNMDNRHIAFSRGLVKLDRITPDGRTVSAARRYSFQGVFEEAAGGLSAYTSFWSDVEITGVY